MTNVCLFCKKLPVFGKNISLLKTDAEQLLFFQNRDIIIAYGKKSA